MKTFHAPSPGERSGEPREGCEVLLPALPVQWATATKSNVSPVVWCSDTGCRYLCPCLLRVLLIPELETWRT